MTKALRGGVGTALVTPFHEDGSIDVDALRASVARQESGGVSFLVPCGSTGEAPTLSLEEREQVVETTAEAVSSGLPIVAGATASSTAVAVETTRRFVAAGATHTLHASPMYNKPPQRGLVDHFRAVADATTSPVVLYNVPGRTASNIDAETTLALAEHPNIVGIKEASADLDQISEIIRHRPDDFFVYSGDDALTLPLMALGAEGVISVVSNVAPDLMSTLVRSAAEGDFTAARDLHHRLTPLMDFAFVESNPIPVKALMAHLGLCNPTMRSPLTALAESYRSEIASVLDRVGISTAEAA